jgi:hypothetical protein
MPQTDRPSVIGCQCGSALVGLEWKDSTDLRIPVEPVLKNAHLFLRWAFKHRGNEGHGPVSPADVLQIRHQKRVASHQPCPAR